MLNKYFIIDSHGLVHDPKKYRGSRLCSEEFKVVIDKEVLGKSVNQNSEKPEYLKYAHKMGFNWEENADIGFIQYDYKANLIVRLVSDYARQLVSKIGFPIYEVKGSNFFDLGHPLVKAYADLFGDRLFKIDSEKNKFVMSYDASYPQFNLAAKYNLREKDLPFAHFSLSDCYRYEQSGECMLLFRGRRFNMPDLHPYFHNLKEAWKYYFEIEKQLESVFASVNRKYVNVVKVSSEKNWNKYQKEICEIARNGNKEMLVEIKMDGQDRYWIIDVDYSIIDASKNIREIGCIQIDVGNAKRLNIYYKDNNNKKHHPVIIHSAVPGGLERFLYMLFDDFKNFPLWLHPIQVRLIPISEKHIEFCEKIANENRDIRIDIDDREEHVNLRVKVAKEELIPNVFLVGNQEMGGNCRDIERKLDEVRSNCSEFPYLSFHWPRKLSQRLL